MKINSIPSFRATFPENGNNCNFVQNAATVAVIEKREQEFKQASEGIRRLAPDYEINRFRRKGKDIFVLTNDKLKKSIKIFIPKSSNFYARELDSFVNLYRLMKQIF